MVAKVLTQMVGVKKVNDPQNEPIENQSLTKKYNVVEEIEGEIEDLNTSYSDTSSDGGVLSSPPPWMIKIQRRIHFIKGQGWTSIVIHPKPKIDKIIELIGGIQDQKEKHTFPISKINNEK